jgi:hypothetical protein
MSERERIEQLNDVLGRLERDLDRSEAATGQKTRGVGTLIRVTAVVVGLLALSNLYFVNDLTDEVRLVITRMEEMNRHFLRVTERMAAVRAEVAGIEGNVRLLPVVSEQMREIAAHVGAMESAVATMQTATAHLDNEVGTMDDAMRDIAVRFRALNQSVGAMGVDVDQMSRTLP